MITKHEILRQRQDVSNISRRLRLHTAVAAVQRKSNVLGSIPSDHATAAPTLVADPPAPGRQYSPAVQTVSLAAPSIAPSTDPASTMATGLPTVPGCTGHRNTYSCRHSEADSFSECHHQHPPNQPSLQSLQVD